MIGSLSLLGRLLRGVRLLEFVALILLLVMVLGVYLEKASAGRERGEIVAVQGQIDEESKRVRLLQAEVAHLEEPDRMEQLSAAIGLAPTPAGRQGELHDLALIASGALVPQMAVRHPPSASTQTGFEGPVTPVSTVPVPSAAGAAR